MDWPSITLWGLGTLAVVASIIPIWRTTRWWVRIWDFPRFQIALLALAVLVVAPLLRPPEGLFDWMLLGSLVGVLLWQSTWVGPYLPGAPRPVKTCEGVVASNRIALLTTNVLQNNRDVHRLIEIIREADPDLVLAVEVDEWWAERLSEGLTARYPNKISYPLSNGYGLALFTRLELIEPRVQFVLDEAIPSVKTGVRLRSGSTMGLQPTLIRSMVDVLGADHILAGTDWPIFEELSVPQRLQAALSACGLDAAEQQLIAAGNALKLLGIT